MRAIRKPIALVDGARLAGLMIEHGVGVKQDRSSASKKLDDLVRDFSGSLDDKKSARGVLMTTSYFTRGAHDYVRTIPKPITLVDGAKLARLMIEHGVGVKQDRSSARTKLDEGYFMRTRGSEDQP